MTRQHTLECSKAYLWHLGNNKEQFELLRFAKHVHKRVIALDHRVHITTGCAWSCQTLYVNSRVPWNCRGAALFFSFHNWHSLSCAFNRLAERRIMPVKTAGVFSIRGVTLSHKQIPYCSLCWHQPPHQHNNKNCIFDETFRSQKKVPKFAQWERAELP